MKQFTMTFDVDDDFEPGCCYECPLSYEEWYEDDDDMNCAQHCIIGVYYDECPIKKESIK